MLDRSRYVLYSLLPKISNLQLHHVHQKKVPSVRNATRTYDCRFPLASMSHTPAFALDATSQSPRTVSVALQPFRPSTRPRVHVLVYRQYDNQCPRRDTWHVQGSAFRKFGGGRWLGSLCGRFDLNDARYVYMVQYIQVMDRCRQSCGAVRI